MSKRSKDKSAVDVHHQAHARGSEAFDTSAAHASLAWFRQLSRTADPWASRLLVAAFLTLQSLWAFGATVDMPDYSDEVHHVPQIERFCRADYTLSPEITSLPGYHLAASTYARLRGDCSRHALRGFNVACGLLVTLTAFAILNTLGSAWALTRTTAFHFLPILFPYHFVVYTDVLSLFFAMFAVWLMLRQRWLVSGIVGSLGIVLRQHNAVVLLLGLLLAAEASEPGLPARAWIIDYAKKTWTSVLGLAAFAVFMVINHGPALGDQSAHPLGVHVGNLYFALSLLALVSFPVGVDLIWRQRAALWPSTIFMTALLCAYLLYMRSFRVDHPYNLHPATMTFVRNIALVWVNQSPLTKMLFFFVVSFGFATVWVAQFSRPSLWLWLPIAVAVLLPDALIEQRYSILPLGLWILLRKDASPSAELLTALSNAAVGIASLWLISGGTWSL